MDAMLQGLLKSTTTEKADTSGSTRFAGVDLSEFGLSEASEEQLQATLQELRLKIANGEELSLQECREAIAILRKNRIEAAEANKGKKKTSTKKQTKAKKAEAGTNLLEGLMAKL